MSTVAERFRNADSAGGVASFVVLKLKPCCSRLQGVHQLSRSVSAVSIALRKSSCAWVTRF